MQCKTMMPILVMTLMYVNIVFWGIILLCYQKLQVSKYESVSLQKQGTLVHLSEQFMGQGLG